MSNKTLTIHEDWARQPGITISSDRTFGLVWTALLALYGLSPLRHGAPIRIWALSISASTLLISIFAPRVLHGPSLLWAKLALLIHSLVNPILMALLFYGFFVPVGLLNRIRGKDPLRLRFDQAASTYWISRPRSGPPSNMTDQF